MDTRQDIFHCSLDQCCVIIFIIKDTVVGQNSINWTLSDYIYNHSVWTEASSSSEQLTVRTSASPCVASGPLSVKVTLWTLLSVTQEVTLSNQTSHSDPPTTAGLNKALHTSHKKILRLRDACCELMTAANRLVRARHDLLTHAHTSPNMSFNNLQKKKSLTSRKRKNRLLSLSGTAHFLSLRKPPITHDWVLHGS